MGVIVGLHGLNQISVVVALETLPEAAASPLVAQTTRCVVDRD